MRQRLHRLRLDAVLGLVPHFQSVYSSEPRAIKDKLPFSQVHALETYLIHSLIVALCECRVAHL